MLFPPPRCGLCHRAATSCTWLFQFKLINMKQNKTRTSSVPPATFQVLHSHTWPVATRLDSTDTDHVHHPRKLHRTMLVPMTVHPLVFARLASFHWSGFSSNVSSLEEAPPHPDTLGHGHPPCPVFGRPCLSPLSPPLIMGSPSHSLKVIYLYITVCPSAAGTEVREGWFLIISAPPVSRKCLCIYLIIYLLNDE